MTPEIFTSLLSRNFLADGLPLVDPQSGDPLVSDIDVPINGLVERVRVTVDISHANLEQLTVQLRSPPGDDQTTITLHAAGAGEDLQLTYPDDADPADGSLDDFIGLEANGEWSLILTDNVIGTISTINAWDIEVTHRSGDQIDFNGRIDMRGNAINNVAEPEADTDAANKAYVDALLDEVQRLQDQARHRGAVYRWAVWSSYNQPQGWYASDGAHLFGGVRPSAWGDGNALAHQMSADKEVQRTLFTRKGYGGANAVVVADEWYYYSSTNSKHAAALFRIRNTTDAPIVWTARTRMTAYAGYSERASIALNGQLIWSSEGATLYTNSQQVTNLTIPPDRVSTVIFVAASTAPSGTRGLLLAFENNCLALPQGLVYVDDLDRAQGGWDQ